MHLRSRSTAGFSATVVVAALVTALGATLQAGRVRAQDNDVEAPDPTRLDVERLPPEAIALTRDRFAHGFFVHANLGARGFTGSLGRLLDPGLLARFGAGYEFADWLLFGVGFEWSLHSLHSSLPPFSGEVAVMDALAELRLQWPISARSMPFLAAEAGGSWASGNLLTVHGYPHAESFSLMYGGSVGFDWHLPSRHHSIGVFAGARMYDGLKAEGHSQAALGIHGAAYLKYVF